MSCQKPGISEEDIRFLIKGNKIHYSNLTLTKAGFPN
jgi:hypothetical protein